MGALGDKIYTVRIGQQLMFEVLRSAKFSTEKIEQLGMTYRDLDNTFEFCDLDE